jgi:hypothetical protein
MKINVNITPRYNIGDEVYVVSHYYDYYPQQDAYKINDVIIDIYDKDVHIRYEVKREDFVEYVPEVWVHSTYSECKKWCDEHNC